MIRLNYAQKHKKPQPSKEELEQAYAVIGETISSMGRKYNCDGHTMKRWMCGYGIQRKTPKQNKAEYDLLKKEKEKEKEQRVGYMGNFDEEAFDIDFDRTEMFRCSLQRNIELLTKKLDITKSTMENLRSHISTIAGNIQVLENDYFLFEEQLERCKKILKQIEERVEREQRQLQQQHNNNNNNVH